MRTRGAQVSTYFWPSQYLSEVNLRTGFSSFFVVSVLIFLSFLWKLTRSFITLPSLHLSLPSHHRTKQTKHTLSHTHTEAEQGGRKTFTGRKKEGGGTFSQEVKGQGPLNQHFGPLKLTAITSPTHTHTQFEAE